MNLTSGSSGGGSACRGHRKYDPQRVETWRRETTGSSCPERGGAGLSFLLHLQQQLLLLLLSSPSRSDARFRLNVGSAAVVLRRRVSGFTSAFKNRRFLRLLQKRVQVVLKTSSEKFQKVQLEETSFLQTALRFITSERLIRFLFL